ncbi:hypothetical protein SEVIR_9G115950v4 [Setaria viridis]|uniref:Uncharacterized protein n=2 Tax=Setaria TaxID=4554 RepID=K4APD8_SETIT|nr:hypothetical protein SEVIR_9G115950v2 [Setaria viridis]
MELSGCKALLLAALIVSSSRLLHGPAGCSAAGAGSPGPALPARPDVGGEEEAKQPGDGEALPFLGRGVRACFPAGAVGRFHQAMLVVLLARGGGRMAAGRWRSSRRRG